MEMFLERYEGMEWPMIALTIVDAVLFALFFISVLYLSVFSFASVSKRSKKYRRSKKQHRFVVIIPIYTKESPVVESVGTFLGQDYPETHYDVIVVSNTTQAAVNERLEGMRARVILSEKETYSKMEAISLAMSLMPEKSYDGVVLMDADNTTEPTFLTQVNSAYASGSMAIQAHRVARNITSDTALFQAVSQEVNNSIFRQGHVNLGLSSALIGSGMIFRFDWLKRNIAATSNMDLEKQLETLLLEQSVFIEYLSDVFVYGERANSPEDFYKERVAWLTARMNGLRLSIRKFPSALLSGKLDYCDKLFQWILPSRTIILGGLSMIAVALSFIYWPMSLKWWGIWFLLIVAFSIAMPDHLIDTRFIKAVKTMPLLFVLTLFSRKKKLEKTQS